VPPSVIDSASLNLTAGHGVLPGPDAERAKISIMPILENSCGHWSNATAAASLFMPNKFGITFGIGVYRLKSFLHDALSES
jgi:hypothetical protein